MIDDYENYLKTARVRLKRFFPNNSHLEYCLSHLVLTCIEMTTETPNKNRVTVQFMDPETGIQMSFWGYTNEF